MAVHGEQREMKPVLKLTTLKFPYTANKLQKTSVKSCLFRYIRGKMFWHFSVEPYECFKLNIPIPPAAPYGLPGAVVCWRFLLFLNVSHMYVGRQ